MDFISAFISMFETVSYKSNIFYKHRVKKLTVCNPVNISPEEARKNIQKIDPYEKAPLPSCSYKKKSCSIDLSVIVPCYNVESFIIQCIESITTQQTRYSYEIIAIDDGSIDSTGSILENLSKKNNVLRVIHQENKGFSGARNAGIALSDGSNIMFVDSDDCLAPNAIENLMNALYDSKADFVTGNYATLSENGSKLTLPKGKRNHGAPWGRIFNRAVFSRINFPDNLWFEDTLIAFCIDNRFKEYYLEKVVYEWRINSNSITHNCIKSKKGCDTYWVVENLLDWCQELNIPFDQYLYDQTLSQFGPIVRGRIASLTESEKKSFFVLACNQIARKEFCGFTTSLSGRWQDLEFALKTRNFALWTFVCKHIK